MTRRKRRAYEEIHTPTSKKALAPVRPYLHGPENLSDFLQKLFGALELECNEDGPVEPDAGHQ